MPWTSLMSLPRASQLYSTLLQAYNTVPRNDPPTSGVYGMINPKQHFDAGRVNLQLPQIETLAPTQMDVTVPTQMDVSPLPQMPDIQRLLDENEALLRSIESNSNI